MRKLVIGMAMASTALASPALARDGQWYIQGDGGVNDCRRFRTSDRKRVLILWAGDATADYGTDYDFGAAVGYDFGWFRMEAEASYRAADLDQVFFRNRRIGAAILRQWWLQHVRRPPRKRWVK